ncbi:AP-2 complex subunit alpha [Kluyveromyces marxianus]|uniref:AP-2 complex subunit alpha n=1 Tax=Kluyveromyces marxianus TaxID=4911 RepID=A0ABX6F7S9_KLUMA|nr:AP-2 complex subunit alpha [Kluyveromyces marxianus]BAP73595.1 AP-2 complex subunit alpha [Kluyveromyces marxianus]
MAPGQSQQNAMKGLQLFIADLRASQKTKDHARRIQNELSNIRKQFSQKGGLNSYQRKKYVAKMAYIYITTNAGMIQELLFGLDQCVQLLKSNNFSDKWVGYMTLELFFNHSVVRNQVMEKTVSCLKSDLSSNDPNIISLALHFIGIVGNRDDIFADNLSDIVFGLLRSPVTDNFIKRKACLALLALIRYKPEVFSNLEEKKRTLWIERITTLLGEGDDDSLLLSLLPLLEFIAANIDVHPLYRLIPQLTDILHDCLSKRAVNVAPSDYKVTDLPNPWLIGKCTSLLDILVSDNGENLIGANVDQRTLGKLRMCVSSAVNLVSVESTDPVAKNAQYTVFFDMLGLACKLDPTNEAIVNSVEGLHNLIACTDLNIRYSTFDLLIKICRLNGRTAIVAVQNNHLSNLFEMLRREGDVTLLRKIIDLLVIITDSNNFKSVVQELLLALQNHKSMGFSLIEDLALKIEKLIERNADDLNWFVISSLKLLSANTSIKDDHVWKRICQIVVNNEPLHKLACEHLIQYLGSPNVAESLVKAGVFLLSEYAQLITDKVSAGDLFNLFTERYFQVGNLTKAMILPAMLKLYHVEPRLSSVVVKFYQLELNSFDVILQTRSYECLKIIQYTKMNDMTFLDKLLPGMPPFTNSSSTINLASKLQQNELLTLDQPSSSGEKSSVSSASTTQQQQQPAPPRSRKDTKLYHSQPLTPGWEAGFKRMAIHKQGVFYQDILMSILFRVERKVDQPSTSKISLTFVNKSHRDISGLSCEIIPFRADNNPQYVFQVVRSPEYKLAAQSGSRTVLEFEITTRFPFPQEQSPLLSLQFKCGGQHSNYRLKIGYTIISTLLPSDNGISLPQFIQRWKSIGDSLGKSGEYSDTIKHQGGEITQAKVLSLLPKIGFDIVEQNSVSNTVFAGGIIHTKSSANYGCLLKIKVSQTENVIDISCRTTSTEDLSRFVVNCVKKAIDQ